jgi:transcriptional regulator with XRE-family HTH domain
MDIGKTIRLLRERHGLKQINLANALQVSSQAVSKWERCANYPDIETLKKIADLFDVSSDYLLGITDIPNGIFEATVFCTGIARFARRSLTTNSRDVAEYINGVFYHLTESVLKYDGVPVKYVGDGFLCFFSGADHADRAIEAAKHAKKVIYQKDLTISISTGEIYLGLVGHPNYATRDTVGATVNHAFLVLGWISNNCPSGIGATEAVIKKAKKTYNTLHHQDVKIDLVEKKIDLYEII